MNRGNTTTKQAVTAIHPRHDDPCPCDSGEKFKHCCAKQKIRWQRNTDGTWTKCVPLVPEAQAITRQERREFLEMIGREPGEGDYLFFRMNAMTTTEEIGRQMDVAIDKAGIRPDIAYATKKTGLLLTKENA